MMIHSHEQLIDINFGFFSYHSVYVRFTELSEIKLCWYHQSIRRLWLPASISDCSEIIVLVQ
jgi:hypothetical protein